MMGRPVHPGLDLDSDWGQFSTMDSKWHRAYETRMVYATRRSLRTRR